MVGEEWRKGERDGGGMGGLGDEGHIRPPGASPPQCHS